MSARLLPTLFLAAALGACAAAPPQPANDVLREQVRATERAFARTMTDRDHAAFVSFLAEETVFYSPGETRGKAAVAERWKKFYEGATPPFSWAPDTVAVLDGGTLALSSGPVHDPSGKLTGSFTSVWRQEAPGVWRIVFDKGCDVCEACPK